MRNQLLILFLSATKEMLHKNHTIIGRGISERFICAELKEKLTYLMNCDEFSSYFADVEYNRGYGYTLKSYSYHGIRYKITCDLIIHSRGTQQIDNLLCVECKKKNGHNIEQDRIRLKCLTSPGGTRIEERETIVADYLLGIFFIIDPKNQIITFELYKRGICLNTLTLSFAELMQLSDFEIRNLADFLLNESRDGIKFIV